MKKTIAELRQEYSMTSLRRDELLDNPMAQFRIWFNEALETEITEPNAMTLSTVAPMGMPSSRIVLLKELQEDGFIFYTNYGSKKAKDMSTNPYVALNFLWKEIQRQVRIEGSVTKTSVEQSTNYFQSRPKGSQIGAWASMQSAVIDGREGMEEAMKKLETEYANDQVLPLPPNWGGYKVKPQLMEFWQGRRNRLHDRFRYTFEKSKWKIERLAP